MQEFKADQLGWQDAPFAVSHSTTVIPKGIFIGALTPTCWRRNPHFRRAPSLPLKTAKFGLKTTKCFFRAVHKASLIPLERSTE